VLKTRASNGTGREREKERKSERERELIQYSMSKRGRMNAVERRGAAECALQCVEARGGRRGIRTSEFDNTWNFARPDEI
jgi:hypothetical protein